MESNMVPKINCIGDFWEAANEAHTQIKESISDFLKLQAALLQTRTINPCFVKDINTAIFPFSVTEGLTKRSKNKPEISNSTASQYICALKKYSPEDYYSYRGNYRVVASEIYKHMLEGEDRENNQSILIHNCEKLLNPLGLEEKEKIKSCLDGAKNYLEKRVKSEEKHQLETKYLREWQSSPAATMAYIILSLSLAQDDFDGWKEIWKDEYILHYEQSEITKDSVFLNRLAWMEEQLFCYSRKIDVADYKKVERYYKNFLAVSENMKKLSSHRLEIIEQHMKIFDHRQAITNEQIDTLRSILKKLESLYSKLVNTPYAKISQQALGNSNYLLSVCYMSLEQQCIDKEDELSKRKEQSEKEGAKQNENVSECLVKAVEYRAEKIKCLNEAIKHNNYQAYIERGEQFWKDEDYASAIELYNLAESRLSLNEYEKGKLLIRWAKALVLNNQPVEARQKYEEAKSLGFSDAERALNLMDKKKRIICSDTIVRRTDNPNEYIFVNSMDDVNTYFVTSIPEEIKCAVFSPSMQDAAKMSLQDFLNKCFGDELIPKHPIKLLFTSHDYNKNLNDTLECLDLLYNRAVDVLKGPSKLEDFIKLIDIYSCIEAEFTALVEASLYDMKELEGLYIKCHLIDVDSTAMQYLITKKPIFMCKSSYPVINIIFLGARRFTYNAIIEVMSIAYSQKAALNIYVIDEEDEINSLVEAFEFNCPDLKIEEDLSENELIDKDTSLKISKRWHIAKCYSDCKFVPMHLYSVNDSYQIDVASSLNRESYYIVSKDEDDLANVLFARQLKQSLLDKNWNTQALVSVHCKDYKSNKLVHYYSKYNLYAFGMPNQILSYNALIGNNYLEEMALRVHLSYGSPESSFYTDFYNNCSSKATACALMYRLYEAGIEIPIDAFANFEAWVKEESVRKKIVDRFKSNSTVEALGEIEHARWCLFVIMHGYRTACPEKIAEYISDTKHHVNKITKRHPYLRPWEKFFSDSSSENTYDSIEMQQHRNRKKRKSDGNGETNTPIENTRNSIKETIGMLIAPEEKKIENIRCQRSERSER